MAKGISLHIGVNECDPEHYSGWSGPLSACEADADVMHTIAQQQGFTSTVLKTADATRGAVAGFIRSAAQALQSGDIFLLSYAGHGGQIKDVDGDEEDLKDETWCLYDGQLLDDELNILWSEFAAGVRIFVLSDSCHSGSVSKGGGAMSARNSLLQAQQETEQHCCRFMPRQAAIGTFRKNREFYANLQYQLPRPRPSIGATVRLFSGCQDDQLSGEGGGNGVFTRTLRNLWDEGNYAGDYASLHRAMEGMMPDYQQPNHLVLGSPNPAFDRQKPFTI